MDSCIIFKVRDDHGLLMHTSYTLLAYCKVLLATCTKVAATLLYYSTI